MSKRYPFSLIFIFTLLLCYSCRLNQGHKEENGLSTYNQGIMQLRAQKDKQVIEDNIIEKEMQGIFRGLVYFDPDSSYRVSAHVKFVAHEPIVFKTNTERSPLYYKFCRLDFKLHDSACSLVAYAEDSLGRTGLFIPFKDKSNYDFTYGGGRYIECAYNGEKDIFVLDFNTAFNPYCHYNHNYSCPLVPYENTLPVSINAGEKKLYP